MDFDRLNGRPIFLRGNSINPPGRNVPDSVGGTKFFASNYLGYMLNVAGVNAVRIGDGAGSPDSRSHSIWTEYNAIFILFGRLKANSLRSRYDLIFRQSIFCTSSMQMGGKSFLQRVHIPIIEQPPINKQPTTNKL